MTLPLLKQFASVSQSLDKTAVRTQFAALCYRLKGPKTQILLVTSRTSRRWIIPKGWPMPGKTAMECAAQEAWEEAGVIGRVDPRPLGLFSYVKEMDDRSDLPCVAMIYPMRALSCADEFPEAGQRKRKWMSRKKAAGLVDSPELSRILRGLDVAALR